MTEINAKINTNGHQAITGSVLNGVLIDMTDTLSVLNAPGTPPNPNAYLLTTRSPSTYDK